MTNICFDCIHAVPDDDGHGCPWSMRFEPVPGWNAELVLLGGYKCKIETYEIKGCPLFERDKGCRDRIPSTAHPIKVRCVETGEVFPSIIDAASSLGERDYKISYALKTGRKFACGYHWEIVENEI